METIEEENNINKKTTDVEKNTNDMIVKGMILMMKVNLTDKGYKLTQPQINWIQNYIDINPTFFTDIYNDMIDLIDDKCIDLHEIPLLIKIFVKIFQDQNIKYKMNEPKNVIAFIKYCFKIFIDYQFIVTNNAEKNVIEIIIDNSLELLALNIMPIEEDSKAEDTCFCFFRK